MSPECCLLWNWLCRDRRPAQRSHMRPQLQTKPWIGIIRKILINQHNRDCHCIIKLSFPWVSWRGSAKSHECPAQHSIIHIFIIMMLMMVMVMVMVIIHMLVTRRIIMIIDWNDQQVESHAGKSHELSIGSTYFFLCSHCWVLQMKNNF